MAERARAPAPAGAPPPPQAAPTLTSRAPLSAMSPRFNLFFQWFAHRFFRHFDLAPETGLGRFGLEYIASGIAPV